MRITFAFKEFGSKTIDKQIDKHLSAHFLLDQAVIDITLTFDDSSRKIYKLKRVANAPFVLDLPASEIPFASGPPPAHKKIIRSLSMDFIVDFTHGRTFRLLRITQEFSLNALPTNSDLNIDYELSPSSWKHTLKAEKMTANRNTHPLVDTSRLKENIILLNALVVDLTELWERFHEDNQFFQFYKDVTDPKLVTFKVFAHLGGNAFLWYSIIPAYLAGTKKVSPHIFFSPSDYAPTQNIKDERDYLLANWKQFKAEKDSSAYYDGQVLLLGYLLPPIDDNRVLTLKPKLTRPHDFEYAVKRLRNVVNFNKTTPKSSTFRTVHWNIPAGFQKAFYGLGGIKPQQFLLMPQFIEIPSPNPKKNAQTIKGSERGPHLTNVTDAILGVLQTNTDLVSTGSTGELVEKDKMILSSYSESGVDMWRSSLTHIDNLKAIIGIEPNSVNPTGRDVIPKLLEKKVRVFIIGRHRGPKKGSPFKNHYRPDISQKLQDQIRFYPDDLAILKYPPNPASNNFVKFRVSRVTDRNLDPFLLEHEKEILETLEKRKPPIKGVKVIPLIFTNEGNLDFVPEGGVQSVFYTHHFALTGGQEMVFDHPFKVYGPDVGVTYRTFFQQAVEDIK